MKLKILKISIFFFGLICLFTSCQKDDGVRLERQMHTWKVRNITSTSAEISGMIVAYDKDEHMGYDKIGVCWGKEPNPTIENEKASINKREKSVYWVKAENLEHVTKYYARAYIYDINGNVKYGEEISFTTLANVPYVDLYNAEDIMGKSAVVMYGLTFDGGDKVTEKGICWSTSENPTVEDNLITSKNQGFYSEKFKIENLIGNTVYFVRSYAKNGVGIGYSKQISFKTKISTPTVITDSASNVGTKSLEAYATVVADGGESVTERGFCWSQSPNPTVEGSNTILVSLDSTIFKAKITNLNPGTEYFIRAYAKNAKGISYGNDYKVKTVTDIVKLYIPGGYQAASGYGDGDWNPEKAPFIMNTKEDKVAQGYVYFASASEFKFTPAPNWDTDYGDDGNGKLKVKGGNLKVDEAGLYLIKADVVNLTWSATKVEWGLIGEAIGGWDKEINMVYSKKWKRLFATAKFVDGEFKMRANHDWNAGIDFGDTGQDGVLDFKSGENIKAKAGTYTFIADLSTREYNYVLTKWGIVGDAVGDWNKDKEMTADVANNTWTFTGDLKKGPMKFRANGEWKLSLGGDENNLKLNTLDNTIIKEDGNYTIVLDLANNKCTITKN